MAGQNSAKGNPASHRMSNPKLKERRARSWRHTEEAKKDGTHPTARRKARTDKLAAVKQKNFGLGQREVRRIIAGKNHRHSLSDEDIKRLMIVK